MNLQQFKDKVKAVPLSGPVFIPDFYKICFGGEEIKGEGYYSTIASLNYRMGKNLVELLGISLTVYVDSQRCHNIIASSLEEIEDKIKEAAEIANKLCLHTYGKELTQQESSQRGIAHYGSCWHNYECEKCGQIFGVDSSG
jgi:hypothetical protein